MSAQQKTINEEDLGLLIAGGYDPFHGKPRIRRIFEKIYLRLEVPSSLPPLLALAVVGFRLGLEERECKKPRVRGRPKSDKRTPKDEKLLKITREWSRTTGKSDDVAVSEVVKLAEKRAVKSPAEALLDPTLDRTANRKRLKRYLDADRRKENDLLVRALMGDGTIFDTRKAG